MLRPAAYLEQYAQGLESGLLSTVEVVAVVLDVLADSPDAAALWASAPETLRQEVYDYLSRVGPANVPEYWVIGVNDAGTRAIQTARRQAVATRLLAGFA